MKLNLSFFFCLLILRGLSQTIPTDSVTGKFKYELVIPTNGLNHSDIYDRAKNWIVRTLKSSDNAINLDDTNKGSINATGNILLNNQNNGLLRFRNVVVNFKFNVYCKDNRYKIIVDNFVLSYDLYLDLGQQSTPVICSLEEGYKQQGLAKNKKATEKTHEEANEKLLKLIEDLKYTVLSNKLPGDKGDW